MPTIETDNLNQKAMLWRCIGRDKYSQPTHEALPEEISVRWLTRGINHESTPDGNSIRLDALAIVECDIPIDSLMWLGSECEWEDSYHGTGSGSSGNEFTEAQDLMIVKTFRSVPDLKGRNYRRKAGLVRFRHDVTAT